jgi:hypothetical protein
MGSGLLCIWTEGSCLLRDLIHGGKKTRNTEILHIFRELKIFNFLERGKREQSQRIVYLI